MKNQSTRKLEKDLLKLHTKDLNDADKLTILHLILDGKIPDAKDFVFHAKSIDLSRDASIDEMK